MELNDHYDFFAKHVIEIFLQDYSEEPEREVDSDL